MTEEVDEFGFSTKPIMEYEWVSSEKDSSGYVIQQRRSPKGFPMFTRPELIQMQTKAWAERVYQGLSEKSLLWGHQTDE